MGGLIESRRASGPIWLELACWSLCAQRQRGPHKPPLPPFDRIKCVYTHSWSAAASSCCHGRMGARGGRRRRPGRPCGSSDRPPRHFGPQQPRPRRVPTPNRLERPAGKSIDARCDASNGVVGCGVDSAAWWSLASFLTPAAVWRHGRGPRTHDSLGMGSIDDAEVCFGRLARSIGCGRARRARDSSKPKSPRNPRAAVLHVERPRSGAQDRGKNCDGRPSVISSRCGGPPGEHGSQFKRATAP